MPRTTHANEYERKLLQNIEVHGWQCTSVSAEEGDEETPPFSYTIGMHHSFGCPEFIVFGLPNETAHAIFGIIANAAKAGRPYPLDMPCADLISDFECIFVSVPREAYDEYVLSSLWFYDGAEFPLYQVVWPSKAGHYPWHAAATAGFKAWQPLLGPVE
jgi:hypothetical protein